VRTHATAQQIGHRSHQCDATATYTHSERRAYALLDGIGSSDEVAAWTRSAARRLARAAAVRGNAEQGLRAVHAVAALEPGRDKPWADLPAAVAVVALAAPGQPLQVAWCGDPRAYLQAGGRLWRLTTDHNQRQVLLDQGLKPGPYDRNTVTSWLGDTAPDPTIGAVTAAARGRLLLASDGAYEPLEDSGRDLAAYLDGSVRRAAHALTTAAIEHATDYADNATALVTDLDT
jgi:serine/threonine protein phosphatase PrpC